jgi:hypothetical protein
MDKTIILEGLSLEDFLNNLRKIVREEITANDNKKVSPLSKTEACRQLGITDKTLRKVMADMNLNEVFPADITRILFKYPKYIRKATINYGLNGLRTDKILDEIDLSLDQELVD